MRSRPVSRGQPQSLQPCIAELLRTCVYPPILLLRVEKILEEDCEDSQFSESQVHIATKSGGSKSVYILYLGDGEVMIQALLAPHLHPLIDLQETTQGSLIELRAYNLRRAARQRGKGDVVYLGVEDYVCITLSRPTTSEAYEDVLTTGGGFIVEEHKSMAPQASTYIQVPSSPAAEIAPQVPSSQESCAYETLKVNLETVKKRRQALHEMSSNARAKRKREDEDDETSIKRRRSEINEFVSSQKTDSCKTIEADPETLRRKQPLAPHELSNYHISQTNQNNESMPIKLEDANSRTIRNTTTNIVPHPTDSTPSAIQHTLLSLLHPPSPLPPRNYPVTVLAAISWISPTVIRQPGSPFPPKRTLKLHDPSISDRQVGISISVFIDAQTFTPRHGTIALFRGVVMQMWKDEVILNAYPTLRGKAWYLDEEEGLEKLGYDVKGMRRWWEERRRARAATAAMVAKEEKAYGSAV